MILSLLENRRSIRKFQKAAVPPELVGRLVEAMLRSPSSRGYNPWSFVVVDDPALLTALGRAKEHGSALLAAAPLAIVVCGDPAVSDVWIEDCSIAALLVHLTAASLGLGSCWVQIRERRHSAGQSACAFVRETLGLPAGSQVEAIVGVGFPAENPGPHSKRSLLYDRVCHNRYGQPWSATD